MSGKSSPLKDSSLLRNGNPGSKEQPFDKASLVTVIFFCSVLSLSPEQCMDMFDEEGFSTDRKRRFWIVKGETFSDHKIQACQGHSKELALANKFDPSKVYDHHVTKKEAITVGKLYHVTKKEGLHGIVDSKELRSMKRWHVHMFDSSGTINGRKGEGYDFIIEIDLVKLVESGHEVWVSRNGVYLASDIDIEFLKFYRYSSKSVIGKEISLEEISNSNTINKLRDEIKEAETKLSRFLEAIKKSEKKLEEAKAKDREKFQKKLDKAIANPEIAKTESSLIDAKTELEDLESKSGSL